jgi:transcriptional regulator with XRE-family HTH domain
MATRCKLHWTYIGGLERGERNPTLTTLKRIADGLGVELHALIGRTDDHADKVLSTREKKEGNILKWLKKEDETSVDLATRLVREVVHWQEKYKAPKKH